MYEFYCDPDFNKVIAEARAARREAVRAFWTRMTHPSPAEPGRVAANG